MTTLTARWACRQCDAGAEGPAADVGKHDRAAERHTKATGHCTVQGMGRDAAVEGATGAVSDAEVSGRNADPSR